MFTRTLPGGGKLMVKVAGGRRRRPRTVIVVFKGRRDRGKKRRA